MEIFLFVIEIPANVLCSGEAGGAYLIDHQQLEGDGQQGKYKSARFPPKLHFSAFWKDELTANPYWNLDLSRFNHSSVALQKMSSTVDSSRSISSMNSPMVRSPSGKG